MDSKELVFGLQSDWAILIAIFILTSVQLVKVIIENTKNKREKYEKLRRMATLDKIERYLAILVKGYTEEVTERQLPIIIKEFMGHCKESIVVMGSSSIAKNDIANHKKTVTLKLTQYIHNHFQTLTVHLRLFRWKGIELSTLLSPTWCKEVTEGVINIIVNPNTGSKPETHRQLIYYMNQKFEEYTTDLISKAYDTP